MASMEASILLHQPVPIPERWQHDWFDASHQHSLLYNDGTFYTVSYQEDSPTPILFCCQNDLPPKIIYARISLSKEFIAIQANFTTIVVCDIATRKRYLLEVKGANDGGSILPNGIIWSDHGGATQDLIIITNKAIEFYKVSTKKLYCRLVRSIAHTAFDFWYNHDHRMILTSSFRQQQTFLSRIHHKQSQPKSNNTLKEVFLMDGYFLKAGKANIPMLELPPPDKMPRFELGPGVSNDSIYLVSSYGRLLALVQYTSENEDLLTIYHLFKSGHEKIATLSLGGIMSALKISTYDNLILCHDLFAKKTLVYDLLGPARERISVSATSVLDPIVMPSTVAYSMYPNFDEEDIPGAPKRHRSLQSTTASPSNDSSPSKSINGDMGMINPKIKQFKQLEFITPFVPMPPKARDTMYDALDTSKSQITFTELDPPQSDPSFYSTSQYDIHPIEFAYHRVDRIMWRVTYNLQVMVDQISSFKEKVLFLTRRGRCYQSPRQLYEDSIPHKAVYGVNYESQVAKQLLLSLCFDILERKTLDHYLAKTFFDTLNESYVLEYLRLSTVQNQPHEINLNQYDLDLSQYFLTRQEYYRSMIQPLHERFLTCAVENTVVLATTPNPKTNAANSRTSSPVPLARSMSVATSLAAAASSSSAQSRRGSTVSYPSTNNASGGGLFVRKRSQSTISMNSTLSLSSLSTVSITISSFMDNSLFMDLDMLQVNDALDIGLENKHSSRGGTDSTLHTYLPDITHIGQKVKNWFLDVHNSSSGHKKPVQTAALGSARSDNNNGATEMPIISLDTLSTEYEELSISRVDQSTINNGNSNYPELTTRRDERGDLIVTQSELLSYVWIPLMLSGKVDYIYCTDMLTNYLTLLVDEGIPVLPALCILHMYALFYQERFSDIRNFLAMHFYTESIELALTILQFAGMLEEELKQLSDPSLPLLADKAQVTLRKIQYQQYISYFQLYGINTLWNLNEKTTAIKWHLTHGYVVQAMDLCRKRVGVQDKGLEPVSISGVEFFVSAINHIRAYQVKEDGKEFVKSSTLAAKVETLFYSVFQFLKLWDPRACVPAPNGGRSKIAATTPFPEDLFEGHEDKANAVKRLFGYNI